MQLCQQFQIFRNEARFENQILRRVSGHRQLRREHEFRARRGEPLIRTGDQFAVSTQISDGRVNLSETNSHALQASRETYGRAIVKWIWGGIWYCRRRDSGL